MRGTIIFEDLTTLNCDMDITASYGRQDIGIKITLPYGNITHQQINKYFPYNNNGYVSKQTVRFSTGDHTYVFNGFFLQEISISQFQHNYNGTIEINSTCDYYEIDFNGLSIDLKRELRNKKLKRILKSV